MYEDRLLEIANLFENQENFRDKVGEIAYELYQDRGRSAFEDISKAIEENGIKRKPDTIRQYAWVYEKAVDLKLPKDLFWSIKRDIIIMKNKGQDYSKYMKMIDEGFNSTEIMLAMKSDGRMKVIKEYECPKCHHKWEN